MLQHPLLSVQHNASHGSYGRLHSVTLPTSRRQLRRVLCSVTSPSLTRKTLFVKTTSKEVLTTALECGISSFLFPNDAASTAAEWSKLARFDKYYIRGGTVCSEDGAKAGVWRTISSPADLKLLELETISDGIVFMDAVDWKVIPAENLVAAFQGKAAQLFAVVENASDGQVMLEALEVGVAGVVLCSDDAAQVREISAYLQQHSSPGERLKYEQARVTRVQQVGMGDRACVDMACMLPPGAGLLVGSFARAMFLVHSECEESLYINSRPFRVNAGAVHSYLLSTGGRTRYLSELRSGDSVLVVDPSGRQRSVLVGRIKMESRPMVLVEAEAVDGSRHSVILQNAETVKLVGPTEQAPGWRALSVSALQPGDPVLLLLQAPARHTGIPIQEMILEQ